MNTPLRVLIVDDSEDDARLLVRELTRGDYEPDHRRVDTPEGLLAALDDREWDIIFGDYTMPQFSGTQALSLVRERGLDVPFIFVSGTIGEDTAVEALKSGAQDYVMKGNLKRLLPAVERELREARSRRERERAEAERRAADERFRNILTLAADAVIAVDEESRITVFNNGASQIFGYEPREVIGRSLDLLLPERFRSVHRAHLRAFARAPDSARRMNERGEVWGRRKNGTEFPAEASISKLTENGRTTFTVILRDVTERKRAEQELRLLHMITRAVGEAGDMVAALGVTLNNVCEATGWVLAQAWVPRADGAKIECSPAWYCREKGFETFRTASLSFSFALNEGLPGRVWSSRRFIWVPDIARDAEFRRAAQAGRVGLRAALAVPVLAGDTVVAVLEFFVRDFRKEDERQINLISVVAAQLGTVIQRKRTEERLHYLAHYDPLTDLPNRLLFMDRLRQAMFEASRHDRLVGVVFLDLDRFKTINDSLGHDIGDRLLKSVAERLGRCVREGDTVARLSGDEFTLILADMAHADNAARVAEKILECFAQPFNVDGHELYTSASLGITLCPPDSDSVESLLRNADIAMYRAKEHGGGTYQFYAAEMTSKAHARLALENALRHAVERKEFLLHHQPVIRLADGSVTGVESLVRWRHPQRGLVLPGEFIPLAEQTGLIVRLGEWVLYTACEQCRNFRTADGLALRLAVNISPRQFQQPDMPELVAAVLKRTDFDPALLEFEITESLLMQHADAALAAMSRLSALGVSFSVDDFGTGYSSLSYLKNLPIRRVKIDKSFVRDIPGDANDAAIVTAIISMAHDLGLQVVAEGVETQAQLDFLRDRGCDAIQGYFFSPPITAGEIAGFLKNRKSPAQHG
jgi:diguanylate cyclase (GGDEF)-like protein/PAS domain S-box-containing protein